MTTKTQVKLKVVYITRAMIKLSNAISRLNEYLNWKSVDLPIATNDYSKLNLKWWETVLEKLNEQTKTTF